MKKNNFNKLSRIKVKISTLFSWLDLSDDWHEGGKGKRSEGGLGQMPIIIT